MRTRMTKKLRWGIAGFALLAALVLALILPTTALARDDHAWGEGDGAYTDTTAAAAANTSTTLATAPLATQTPSGGTSGGASFFTHYYVSPIALGFFLVYAVSFVLYKTKRIRVATHRKIWNVLLLATFLITGVFGLILVIQLDYTLPFRMPIDLLFWHVEAGIVMTLISLFHIGWHFKYYANLLRSSRSKARAAAAGEHAYAQPPLRRGQVVMNRESVRATEHRQPGWEAL